jgi:hypothetical protein
MHTNPKGSTVTKLTTIWTLPAMTLRERLRRTADWADLKIAARLPKRVRYWAFVLASLDAMGNEVPHGMSFEDVHQRVPGTPRT